MKKGFIKNRTKEKNCLLQFEIDILGQTIFQGNSFGFVVFCSKITISLSRIHMSHSITLNEHGFLENSKNQAHTAVPVVSQCLILSESPSNELTLDIRSFKKFLGIDQ